MPNNRDSGSTNQAWYNPFIVDESEQTESEPSPTIDGTIGIDLGQPIMPRAISRDELSGVYPPITARQGLSGGVAIQAMLEAEQHRAMQHRAGVQYPDDHARHLESHDGLRASLQQSDTGRYGYSSSSIAQPYDPSSLPSNTYGRMVAESGTRINIPDGYATISTSSYESNSPTVSEFNALVSKFDALLATITELKEDNAYLKAVLDEEFSVKVRNGKV